MDRRSALYILVCGAGPARDIDQLARLALDDGWKVHVGATPAGLEFLDTAKLADLTANPVRDTWSGRTSSWAPADAVIVAPATINTVNKIALGITDTWVVNVVVECMGHGVPIVIAPNVNPALGLHRQFRRSVEELRQGGVFVLWEPNPTPPTWMAGWPQILAGVRTHMTASTTDPEIPVVSLRAPLTAEDVEARIAERLGWSGDTSRLEKTFHVHYDTAMHIVGDIATAAVELEHRPDIDIRWDSLRIVMTTHTSGDIVTELDFLLADRIDAIAAEHGAVPPA